MLTNLLHHPGVDYLRALTGTRITRFGQARRQGDLGASAIELAIITAIVVGLAAGVLVIVSTIVTNRTNEINTNNGKIP
jgi:multisubunit Na+/H+ antiporter MnhC subunit